MWLIFDSVKQNRIISCRISIFGALYGLYMMPWDVRVRWHFFYFWGVRYHFHGSSKKKIQNESTAHANALHGTIAGTRCIRSACLYPLKYRVKKKWRRRKGYEPIKKWQRLRKSSTRAKSRSFGSQISKWLIWSEIIKLFYRTTSSELTDKLVRIKHVIW